MTSTDDTCGEDGVRLGDVDGEGGAVNGAARGDDRAFVTPVCGSPHFDRPGTSAEAQAFHLLAVAAARPWRG